MHLASARRKFVAAQKGFAGANGLANFFFIDQSLDGVGGHHFDSLRLISEAAIEQGYNVIAGASMKLDKRASEIPSLSGIELVPAFRNSTYSPLSQLGGLRKTTRSKFPSLEEIDSTSVSPHQVFKRWKRRNLLKLQDRFVSDFAFDCDRFFKNYSLEKDDIVLFMTVNELDFLGLGSFLANNPHTLQPTWNTVFHFGIFSGRPDSYSSQKKQLQGVRGAMQNCLSRIPYHQVNLLASTDELADQYNRMGIGHFKTLPYPIDQQFSESTDDNTNPDSMNITIAGGVRREKGKRAIAKVSQDLAKLNKSDNRIQLSIQRRKRSPLSRPVIRVKLPSDTNANFLKLVDHPLSESKYRELIQDTKIGLLLHDSHSYFCRRAGILGEYLSSGIPVVVPAGCWLSQQISEPTFRYIENLISTKSTGAPTSIDQLEYSADNVPLNGGVMSFDQGQHPFELTGQLDARSAALAISFDWHWPKGDGSYLNAKFVGFDSQGKAIQENLQILGLRKRSQSPHFLINLAPGIEYFKLRFTNGFTNTNMSIQNFKMHPIGQPGEVFPTYSVGVPFSCHDEVAQAVAEVVNNYAHYKTAAANFAKGWNRRHNPEFTFNFLVGDTSQERFVA